MEIRTQMLNVYYSPAIGDCTNNGISANWNTLEVACPNGGHKFDSERLPENFCMLVRENHSFGTSFHIVPAEVDVYGELRPRGGKHYMMGGNFAFTSDCRLAELTAPFIPGAIAIHDRVEE